MNKIELGNKGYFYPLPTVLVGANVKGKSNFLNISYCSLVNRIPAMISISLNRSHYTCEGIKQNKSFSVNIPSLKMLETTDYCGLVSGKDVDKSKLFNVFYGSLKTAPMIEECPINIECKVVQELDLGGSNLVIIGEIIQTYSEEKYITNNFPDLKKIDPILFSPFQCNYYSVGEKIGKAWHVGNTLKSTYTRDT
jgi:flavin reductase (DIM6/NTAB) family NADH-FMN oxidoreductase RutF